MASVAAFVRALVVGAFFVAFFTGALVLSWAVLPVVQWRARRLPEVERLRRCQDVVGHGYRLFHFGMRFMRALVFAPRETPLDLPAGAFVLVANHPTLIDVTALLAMNPRMCVVAKPELFRNPAVGRLLRACGHLEGGSGASMEGASVMQQALDRLAAGMPVVIFPEGTRSPPREVGAFRRGAFEIALRAKVPVVPVFLSCDPPTLMKGQRWYRLPKRTARLVAEQLPTVAPASFEPSSRALAARVHASLRQRVEAFNAAHPVVDEVAAEAAGLVEGSHG